MFPDEDMGQVMTHPDYLLEITKGTGLDKVVMINALDLLCFWMYQPRAASALALALQGMDEEERRILLVSQRVLTQEREVSLFFVEGTLGNRFARALSFYLTRYNVYLGALTKLVQRTGLHGEREHRTSLCSGSRVSSD
jgi:hypothetical protein